MNTVLSLLAASLAIFQVVTAELRLTGIIDGPRFGGLPKAVELYTTTDINLADYCITRAVNAGADPTSCTTPLTGTTLSAGQYYYASFEASGFAAYFGFSPDHVTGSLNINGDDRVLLFKNNMVIDYYGVPNTLGDGEPWDYTDSWAYRNDNTGPDTTWQQNDWTYGGRGLLKSLGSSGTNPASGSQRFPVGTYTCSSSQCGGDPHVQPWRGDRFYFMGECDAVMLASKEVDIHIRTTIKDFYSYIHTTAIRVGQSVLELSVGNKHIFYVNGEELTDDDLPMELEGKYTLRLGDAVTRGIGTNYVLSMGKFTVKLRTLRQVMAVELVGSLDSFNEGTGGLTGKFPTGELLGRDGTTLFTKDGMFTTIRGVDEPVCDSFGSEWQVSDSDPQLFRAVREPAWPAQCRFPDQSSARSSIRRRLATIDVETASKACAEVHREDSNDFEFCVMDVIMLNDVEAAYSW